MTNIFSLFTDNLKKAINGDFDATIAQGSLTGYLSKSIIECTVIVPNNLKTHEQTQKAIDIQMNIFTANVAKAFKALAESETNKDIDYAFKMVSSKTVLENKLSFEDMSSVAYTDDAVFPLDVSLESKDDVTKIYREIDVKVTVTTNEGSLHTITIPLLIVAPIIYATPKEVTGAIKANTGETKLPQRWHAYRSGSISLVNLLLGNDIWEAYQGDKKNPNRLLEDMNKSRMKSMMRLVSTRAEGFVKYYRLVVISNKELEQLELTYNGKISKARVKEKILDTFGALMITVLDDDFDMLDVYIRDIKDRISVPYKSKNGDNIGDMFKFISNRTI